MRFVIYKNSILATFCSMIGAAAIAMAVMTLIDGEIGILPGIGMIAVGIGLMWLADLISTKKAQRKQAKAAAAKAAASGMTYTQPQQAPRATAVPSHGKPVKKCVVFAGIFFLLAALLCLWAFYLYREYMSRIHYTLDIETAMQIGMGALLLIAALRTRHTQEVSVLFVLGFLGLTLGSADAALRIYRIYGFQGYTSDMGIHYIVILTPLLRAVGYFLMTVLALLSMRKIKGKLGGIVRFFWLLPILALLLAFAKEISDNYIWDRLRILFAKGFQNLKYRPNPEYLNALSQLLMIPAVFLSGFCFRRICRKSAAAYTQVETQPAQVPPVQVPPVQTAPVNPQPEPRYTAPEPPRQTVQPTPAASRANDPDTQKKIQACKDLLECGILSQEEYDQKIRELMQG